MSSMNVNKTRQPMTLHEIDQMEMASFTLILKQRLMSLMSGNSLNTRKIKDLMEIIRMTSPYFAEHYRENEAFQLDLDTISRRTILLMYEYLAFDRFPDIRSLEHSPFLPLANRKAHEEPLKSTGMQKSDSWESVASTSTLPVIALPSKAALANSTSTVVVSGKQPHVQAEAKANQPVPATSSASAKTDYCSICKRSFAPGRGLLQHLANPRMKQGHPRCELCGLNFPALDALEVHNQTSHQPEPLSEPAGDATVSLPHPQTPHLTPSSSQSSLPSTNLSPAVDPLFSLLQQAQQPGKSCPDDFARSLDEPALDCVPLPTEELQAIPADAEIHSSMGSKCLKGVTIAFSNIAAKHIGISALKSLAKRTGAFLLLDTQFERLSQATHYLHASQYTSFGDFQMAVNRDLWICSTDWLFDCANQQTWLDETKYLLAPKLHPRPPLRAPVPPSTESSPAIGQVPSYDSGLLKPAGPIENLMKHLRTEKPGLHTCPNCSETFEAVDRYVDHLVLDGCLTRKRDGARPSRTVNLNPLLGVERSYIDQTLDTVAKIDDAVSLLRPLLLNLRYTSGDTPLQEVLTLFQTDVQKLQSNKEVNAKPGSRKAPQPRRPTCSICLNQARQLHGLSCGHLGCKHCLTSCVTQHEKCPVCRTKQTLADLRPVYWDV